MRNQRAACLATAVALVALASCRVWNPCDRRVDRASCALYDVDVRYESGQVVAIAGYHARGPAGVRRAGKRVVYPVPDGVAPAEAMARVRAHIERHAAVGCEWRVVTRGGDACVDQVVVALPGCPADGSCDRLRVLPR